MSSITRSGSARLLSKLIAIVLCALCVQPLYGCATKTGDEAVVDAICKYAYSRTKLDVAATSVYRDTPDATTEIEYMGLEKTPDGLKEVKIVPTIVSDTMASWSADEWATHRDDLFFNFSVGFVVSCKQANEYGGIPEDYVVTCPEYLVVYNAQKTKGFIVNSTGVYHKTDDPENPIGQAVALAKDRQ